MSAPHQGADGRSISVLALGVVGLAVLTIPAAFTVGGMLAALAAVIAITSGTLGTRTD